MDKSALAQEKVWFDKPAYDRAERLYFERLGKVVSRKIMDISVPEPCWEPISAPITTSASTQSKKKSKSKSKENKENREKAQAIQSAANEGVKSPKCQKKADKAHKNVDEYEQQKQESHSEEKWKNDNNARNNAKEKEVAETNPARNEKCSAKEMKEEKNKADTRHRNHGKGKSNAEKENRELKESLPLVKNIEQLPNQGNQQPATPILPTGGSLANEVAKARQHIIQSLQCVEDIATVAGVCQGVDVNKSFMELHAGLKEAIAKLEQRVNVLEEQVRSSLPEVCPKMCPVLAVCPAKPVTPAAKQQPKEKEDEDDYIDLFGSESEGEDEEAAKVREERLAAYAAKKAKKPVLIAKSSIILDVKPWDDETDMPTMEAEVRKIEMNGLLWGAAKLVPLAFGIHKLQISCVVEDDKVSVDELTEKIQDIEDFVQSVDIAAFNKI